MCLADAATPGAAFRLPIEPCGCGIYDQANYPLSLLAHIESIAKQQQRSSEFFGLTMKRCQGGTAISASYQT
jgi:hypothetical protein